MTIPTEFVVWMLASIFGVASFGVHVLIRINAKIGDIQTSSAVDKVAVELRLESLERHRQNHERERAWMRTGAEKHLGVFGEKA